MNSSEAQKRGCRGWPKGLRGELTGRDLEIATWVERLMGAGLEDVRLRFGLGRSQAYRRLQVLQQFGVIRSQRMRVDLPTVYLTASRLLRPASFEHVLLVSRLVAAREAAGRQVATEVELRRARSGEPALPAWMDEDQRGTAFSSRRIPDAIEGLSSGGLRAFEIELSSKGKARRETVLGNYAASNFEQVTWLVPDRQLAALIHREIDGLGLARFMEVRDEW